MLQPLGDRILIRPEENATQTASGLHVVEQFAQPEVMGEVVSVGFCTHPLRADALALADRIDDRRLSSAEVWTYSKEDEDSLLADISSSVAMLRELTARQPSVKVGDIVVFSVKSGQEIQVDGTRYLIMRESDLLAVLEGVS